MPFRSRTARVFTTLLVACAASSPTYAAFDSLNGKALYNLIPDAPQSCVSCHDDPSFNQNRILTAANDPAVIQGAINTNLGGMNFLSQYLSADQLTDISAYLADRFVQGVALSLDTVRLQYGVQPVGVAAPARRVTLVNFGTAALSIASAAIGGANAADYSLAGTSTCSTTSMVAAAGSCFFDVGYSPGDVGARTATLSIASSASVSPHSVSLTGGQAVVLGVGSSGATNAGGGGCALQTNAVFDPTLALVLSAALLYFARTRSLRWAAACATAVVLITSLPADAAQIGGAVPDFELPDFRHSKVKLSQLRGKVVYVDFWASWCGPCRKSFPWMNAMQDKYGRDGLQVIAINMDQEKADAEAFLAQLPASFKVVWDPHGETARMFNVKGMPSSFVIDREGKLHKSHTGFRVSQQETLERAIQQLLAAR